MAQTGQQSQGNKSPKLELDNLKKALQVYGNEYITILKQVISTDGKFGGHNDTRKLINSLKAEVIEVLNQLVINITDIGYLQYLDRGRKKNQKMIPISALEGWVQRKGINTFKGKTISTKSAAFMVAKSIQKKGIAPTNVKKKAVKQFLANKKALNDVATAAKMDLVKMTSNILNLNLS
jgi:hypothetical protein